MTTIIIKKVKKAGHAHHGGAWKIAYADFVTAMMAFFLLMWLISMTTQEQKIGLAEYFSPAALSPATSGAGGILYGTALDTAGNKPSTPATRRGLCRAGGHSAPDQSGPHQRARCQPPGRQRAGQLERHSQPPAGAPDDARHCRAVEEHRDRADQGGRERVPRGPGRPLHVPRGLCRALRAHPSRAGGARARPAPDAQSPVHHRLHGRCAPGLGTGRRTLEPLRRARARRARDPVGCRGSQRQLLRRVGTRRHRAGFPRQSLPRAEPTGDDHAAQCEPAGAPGTFFADDETCADTDDTARSAVESASDHRGVSRFAPDPEPPRRVRREAAEPERPARSQRLRAAAAMDGPAERGAFEASPPRRGLVKPGCRFAPRLEDGITGAGPAACQVPVPASAMMRCSRRGIRSGRAGPRRSRPR